MRKMQDGEDVYQSIQANYLYESENKTKYRFSCQQMDQEVGTPENFNKAVYKIRTECSDQIHKAGLINEDCLKNTAEKDKKNEEKKRIKFTDNNVEMSPESNQDNNKNVSAFRRVTRS